MGKAVLDLQNKLPRARVVYASATGTLTHTYKHTFVHVHATHTQILREYLFVISASGASEPKNMIYMSRLGIWGEGTPFRAFEDFLHAIEKRFVKFLRAFQSCGYISSNCRAN